MGFLWAVCVWFDLLYREKATIIPPSTVLENGKTNYGTRAFNENPVGLSGPDSTASADLSAARRKFVVSETAVLLAVQL
jgi:hypothetical protein